MPRRPSLRAALRVALLAAASLAHARPGAADELPPRPPTSADGAYGRLEGDVAPSLEAGVSAGSRTTAVVQGRLLYLATAGVQAAWFAPRHGDHGSVSLGAEVRPLFLARFLSNREQGPARVDLLLDSIHLGMAARLGPRRPGLDLSAGLELPLPRSFQGFFLGLQGLWSLPHAAQIGPHGSEGLALLTLGFRGVVDAHVVDSRDRVYR